jgi:hypothetical protein
MTPDKRFERSVRRHMKHLLQIVLISGLASLTACASYPQDRYCKLSPDQVTTSRENLAPILESISNETLRYWPRILEDRYIYKRPGFCLCM